MRITETYVGCVSKKQFSPTGVWGLQPACLATSDSSACDPRLLKEGEEAKKRSLEALDMLNAEE
jgi:hypothetical protein